MLFFLLNLQYTFINVYKNLSKNYNYKNIKLLKYKLKLIKLIIKKYLIKSQKIFNNS